LAKALGSNSGTRIEPKSIGGNDFCAGSLYSQQWYLGVKAHIGADSKTKLIQALVATAANVHDATILFDLLHGEETRVGRPGLHRLRPP
jgi:IS5 family transposase